MNPEDSPRGERGDRYPGRLYLALAALTVLSCLGLDFMASQQGERTYLFPYRPSRGAQPAAPVSLAALAGRLFDEKGLAEKVIRVGRSREGQPEYTLELTKETYLGLAAPLQFIFRDHQASARVEEQESEGRTTYSWYVQRGDQEKLTLQFSCLPLARPERDELRVPELGSPVPAASEKIAAIIIDDMGTSLESLQEVLDLGIPLTISVLPQSPYALETAQTAHDRRLEVMLHLPGESLNRQEGETPLAALVRSDMSPGEIRAFVLDSLNRVPFATGVNNHMGSRITRDRAVMTPVLDVLRERRLFFIDSLTGNGSVAYDQARKMGLRSGYRNVFLDSEVGVDYSRKKLVELFELAKSRGRAVGIGHPFPETLQALRDCLSLPRLYGVRLVLASQALPD